MKGKVVPDNSSSSPTWLLESFFVFALISSTGAFSYQLTGLEPTDVVPANPLSFAGRISYFLIYGASLLICVVYRRSVYWSIRASWLLFVLPLLAIASSAWAPEPAVSVRRSMGLLFNLLTIIALVSTLPVFKVMRVFMLTLSISVMLSLVWVIVLPKYGIHSRSDWSESVHAGLWRGVYTHKNTLGAISSLALIMFVFFGTEVFRYFLSRIISILAAVMCLIGSRSGTALVLAVIAACVIAFFRSLAKLNKPSRAFFASIGLTTFTLLAFAGAPITLMIADALGKDTDLTGRLPVWETLTMWTHERPLLGFGYATGLEYELMPRMHEYLGFKLPNAHNGFIEVFIGLGYVGVILLTILLASYLKRIVGLLLIASWYEMYILSFICGLFFTSVIMNITESTFFMPNNFGNMFFVLGYALVSVHSIRIHSLRKLVVPEYSKHLNQSGEART